MVNSIFSASKLLAACILLAVATILPAQQNQKVIFPNPAGYITYLGQPHTAILKTPDGGWLLQSYTIDDTDSNAFPRLVKLDGDGLTEWDNQYLNPGVPVSPGYYFMEPLGLLNAPDGGWMMSFRDDTSGFELLKIAPDGSEVFKADVGATPFGMELLGVINNTYYGAAMQYGTGGFQWELIQTDLQGSPIGTNVTLPTVWQNFNEGNGIILTSGNEIQAFATVNGSGGIKKYFIRYDLSGNILWQSQPLPFSNVTLLPASDNGFYAIFNGAVYRYDATGTLTDQINPAEVPGVQSFSAVDTYADGSYFLSGRTITNRGFMARMDAAHNIIWTAESPEDAQAALNEVKGIPEADGWGAGIGITAVPSIGFMRVFEDTGIEVDTLHGVVARDIDNDCTIDGASLNGTAVTAANANGTHTAFSKPDGSYTLFLPPGDFVVNADPVEQFFFLCPQIAGTTVSFTSGSNESSLLNLPIQAQGLIHEIEGTVQLDLNNSCTVDAGDTPLSVWPVTVYATGVYLNTYTDANGHYSFYVPDGTYTVSVNPINPSFGICGPSTQTTAFNSTAPQVFTANFSATAAFDCGLMKTWVTNTVVRPCTTAVFQVSYQNVGTVSVDDVSITVTLDPFLTYQSSSLTPTSVNGNVLTFDLGTVQPLLYSSGFNISALPDCNLTAGQQVCVTSAVFPDTLCYNFAGWSGAVITVAAACDAGQTEAVFTFENIGSAASQALEYVIVEDQIVLKNGEFTLDPGQIFQEIVPVNGITLIGSSQQEPGFPGDTTVSYSLVNCMGMPGMPGGFGGNAGPFVYQGCYTVTTSFDPNDKRARPEGFGPDHIVVPGTILEYMIRFQNTGNDTAFLVVLRDTLSSDLDPSTIELRGASHPYRFDLLGGNLVQFTFENILLPDSSTNLAASQGYVEFAVKHRKDLPLGTIIENKAAIYFDFNAPVMTNSVGRKIDQYFTVSLVKEAASGLDVSFAPNPVINSALITLGSKTAENEWYFKLTDATGKLLRTDHFNGNQYLFERGNLTEGVYFWTIDNASGSGASGRVVVVRN